MNTQRKEDPVASKTDTPCGAQSLAGKKEGDNLPPVSRQTAGGIAGAAIGGIVAGPLGAVLAGVAGALVGNASAAGDRPVMRTVEGIRSVAEPSARLAFKGISEAISRHRVTRKKKAATKKAAAITKARKAGTLKAATKARARKTTTRAAAAATLAARKPSKMAT